jgi:acyl carrier protein
MNTMETVEEKVRKIVADTLGTDELKLSPETDVYKHLGADSLDVVELVVNLEREFNVTIPDEKVERMTTIQQFTEHFEKVKSIPETFFFSGKAA